MKRPSPSNERRDANRYEVETLLPVKMVRGDTEADLVCRVLDLSPDGLCVLLKESVQEGARLRFVTLKREFSFDVAWCRSEPAPSRDFRCGLALVGPDDELKALFAGFFPKNATG